MNNQQEKVEKSLLNMRAKLDRIADLALAADAKCGTCDKIGQNWMTCSKALCEIRDLCGPSILEKARGESAAEEIFSTLGMAELPAKVIPHDEPAAEVPRTEEEKQKQREIEHFSFCNGVFPIHTVRTPSGSMGKCEINGRKFSFSSVDASGPDDHACTVRIWDGGNQIAFMTVLRGRSIAEPMAMGAFKAYVKQLSGSKKFHGRGGFLKQAMKLLQEKGQE